MNKVTKKFLDIILYYPINTFLKLGGYNSSKWKIRLATEKLSDYLYGHVELSDGDKVEQFGWKDLLTLKRHWKGRLKRYFMFWFRKGYVEKQMHKRKGECSRCGYCCNQLECRFAIKKGDRWECSIHPYWPVSCAVYPINEKDVIEYNCPGFSFEPADELQPKGVLV